MPDTLRQYGPLSASIAFDVIWAAWHFEIFFHSVSADAPFFTAVGLSILTTVWFLHTRGSVLLATAMHGTGIPEKFRGSFPNRGSTSSWLRAVVVITIALSCRGCDAWQSWPRPKAACGALF